MSDFAVAAIVAQIPSTIAAIVAAVIALRVKKETKEIHVAVNSNTDRLKSEIVELKAIIEAHDKKAGGS